MAREVTEAELIAAIRADPSDEAGYAAYADWLTERDDPRGELLLLEHADWFRRLEDPFLLRRLLEHAARHGFLWVLGEPPLPALPWKSIGTATVEFRARHGDRALAVQYGHRELRITEQLPIDADAARDRVRWYEHDFAANDEWTRAEQSVALALIGEAIWLDRLDALRLPSAPAIAAHARLKVCRDHARWIDRWEAMVVAEGYPLRRPAAGPVRIDDQRRLRL